MNSTLRRLSPALVLLFSGCSGSPLPFSELRDMAIFPERVGTWVREGEPTSDAYQTPGYIHAVYCYGEDGLCCFKVWVIDKRTPEKADEWIERLGAGTHTESSIRPLSASLLATSADIVEFHRGFARTSETIKGSEACERLDSSGGTIVSYNAYFAHGRFVIGGSHAPFPCPTRSARDARGRFWPLFEGLNLSE